jgi:hypothetical protein
MGETTESTGGYPPIVFVGWPDCVRGSFSGVSMP